MRDDQMLNMYQEWFIGLEWRAALQFPTLQREGIPNRCGDSDSTTSICSVIPDWHGGTELSGQNQQETLKYCIYLDHLSFTPDSLRALGASRQRADRDGIKRGGAHQAQNDILLLTYHIILISDDLLIIKICFNSIFEPEKGQNW